MQRLKSLNQKIAALTEDGQEASMDADMPEEDAAALEESGRSHGLFKGFVFFLSREVPRYSLEFVLRAFGATVCYPETSGLGSPYTEDAKEITHQIVDRDNIHIVPGRVYIQPQWVYDCINRGELVKETEYGVGKALPPHLSPFVKYDEDDYIPEEDAAHVAETSTENKLVVTVQAQEKSHQMELEAEAAGVPFSEFAEAAATTAPVMAPSQESIKNKKKKRELEEKKELAKMVMSNKQRKILESVDRGKRKKTESAQDLRRKKQAIGK